MKIAKVEHYRCEEWTATTYVWVPDDMSADQLAGFAEAAYESYWKAEEDFKKLDAPPNPGYAPEYDKSPEKIVAQVKAEHKAKLDAYTAWNKKRNEARLSYPEHLEIVSDGLIKDFHNGVKDAPRVQVSWGHRHGETLEFGDSTPYDYNREKQDDDERWV